MLTLLDPRVWLAAAIVCALAFGAGFLKGRSHERLVFAAAQSEANEQARETEKLRQRSRDVAVDAAAVREVRLRADAAGAARARDGLLGAVASAQQASRESAAAAEHATRTLGIVVNECSKELGEVAEFADRAVSENRTLRDAWPR